jgi:predicted N-acetyltransferase YhbS
VVPAVLLGRLAVARHYQGHRLGGILLADALKRTSRAEFGVFAMVVDAKDEAAQHFYKHHGFTLFPGETRRLCLPIAASASAFGGQTDLGKVVGPPSGRRVTTDAWRLIADRIL